MLPFHPPLPTAWNFPFQPDAGSHTSILMSESAEGASVAVTRQNAGSFAKRGTAGAAGPGGVNAPGATCCAAVIFALGSASAAMASHVAAAALDTKAAKTTKLTKKVTLR